MNYALQCSETLAKRKFSSCCSYVMFTKHWQAPKKTKENKPLDAPNIDMHKNSNNYPEVEPQFLDFFFGACAGFLNIALCFFCFFWCLCRFGDSDFTKHLQAPKKKKKTEKSRTMDPRLLTSCQNVCLLFFCFFWCLCRFPQH